MEYYNLESQEPDAVEVNIKAFTKFTPLTWFLYQQKARVAAVMIWSAIVYVIFVVVKSFINGECKHKQSNTISYSILLIGLIAFYAKVIHKHVSLPFHTRSYKDNFNGVGSVYHQMNNLHLAAREEYNAEEAKQNEYAENVKRVFAPGLSDEERRQYYKEILKPIPSEDIKQEYDERTSPHIQPDNQTPKQQNNVEYETPRQPMSRMRKRIVEEFDFDYA